MTTTKHHYRRITEFGRKPKSAYTAIKQAHDLLEQEGRWIQSSWFDADSDSSGPRTDDGEVILDPQAPLCGEGWGACADGALLAVTQGLPYLRENGQCLLQDDSTSPKNDPAYKQAREILDLVAACTPRPLGDYYGRPMMYTDIISLNDDATTRDDVLEAFRKGMKAAKRYQRDVKAVMAASVKATA